MAESNSSSKSALKKIDQQIQDLAKQYQGIEQGELAPASQAVKQALQAPSQKDVQKAVKALDEAAKKTAQQQSATSTFHGQKAAQNASNQLNLMAKQLQQALNGMGGKGKTGGTNGANKNGGDGSRDGGEIGGRKAGTQPSFNHAGGSPPNSDENPQESEKNKLTPQMLGEEKSDHNASKPMPSNLTRHDEQALAKAQDPDIILDKNFQKRVEIVRSTNQMRRN